MQVAWMLDYLGVDAIEISPIISRSHEEACKMMLNAGLITSIVAHVRALTSDIDVARKCGAEWVAIFHSVSDIHLKTKLRVTREKALERSVEAVEYAKSHGLKLRFTVEDASRADPEFLQIFCKEIADAGADRISIPDTVGVLRPEGMSTLVSTVRDAVNTPLDVHCHNDMGLAVANSLAGFEAGASQIHTTIDGIGERVGIAPLAEVVIALQLIYGVKLAARMEMLKELSELIENYTGHITPPSKPIVGLNAFRHKAGTHLAAVIRDPMAYEIIPPRLVGCTRRLVFGELSGKHSAAFLLKLFGLEPDEVQATRFAKGLKKLRHGDLFELSIDRDLERMVLRTDEQIQKDEERR